MWAHRGVGILAIAIGLTVAGCDDGDTGSQATSSSQGGSGSSGSGATGGSGGSGGAGGSGASGGAGASGGSGGAGGAIDAADYAGIDPSTLPIGTAPSGCVGQFDAATGALALVLGEGVSGVLVGAVDGQIQANGVVCTAADQTPATTENTRSIQITGTAADEQVIVDLASGPFGSKIFGADGGIHVDGGGGSDAFGLRGSPGKDEVSAGMAGAAVVFDVSSHGAADIDVAGAESFVLSLGPGNDVVAGTGIAGGAEATVDLVVFGDAGNDQLRGGAGNDQLHGGAGDDSFGTADSPDGADMYDGGDGVDGVDYSGRTKALTVIVGAPGNDGEASENDDVDASVEVLFGGSADDALTGGPGNDEIHGGAGNDTIHGGDGDDLLNGDDGNDELSGDEGDDSLFGDAGTDTMTGGAGSDLLDGGEGVDAFDGGDGDGDVCVMEGAEDPASCELY